MVGWSGRDGEIWWFQGAFVDVKSVSMYYIYIMYTSCSIFLTSHFVSIWFYIWYSIYMYIYSDYTFIIIFEVIYIYIKYMCIYINHHGFHELFNISLQAFAGRKRGKNPWHVEDICMRVASHLLGIRGAKWIKGIVGLNDCTRSVPPSLGCKDFFGCH